MPDDRKAPPTSSVPLTPSGEVVLTHLDAPPSTGKHTIHPRRPAPIVPEHVPDKVDEDATDK
jgi:hypothetical protein